MKIALANDHAGFEYKEAIKEKLENMGHQVEDFGSFSKEACDYPDFIRPAAQAVANGRCERGIILGGTGNGEAIVANKIAGIRCALCWNLQSAALSRAHNDANMIALGQRMMSLKSALDIVKVWLETPFDGGRHKKRIEKIEKQPKTEEM